MPSFSGTPVRLLLQSQTRSFVQWKLCQRGQRALAWPNRTWLSLKRHGKGYSTLESTSAIAAALIRCFN